MKELYQSVPNNMEPIHADDLKNAAAERINVISKEFERGFEFLSKYPKSVSIFGSARFSESHPEFKKAENLASRIVRELGYAVVTGGGPGIMAAGNKGAYEAGGNSVGLTIQLPTEQMSNLFLTDHLDFYYFFSRKVCLAFAAEAYVFFPGGFGTMDEFFEILTLVQTRKIDRVPIFLIDDNYWKETDKFIRKTLLERGTISEEDTDLYTICSHEDEIIETIQNAPIKRGV